MFTASRTDVIESLRARIRGEVLVPGDPGYDTARTGFNLAAAHRPAVVVVAADAADVAEAVRVADGHDLGVGVQSTGHGVAAALDGDLLVVTSRLRELAVDTDRCTVRVGAGLTWGPVLEAAQRHGLAPLLGSSPNVGVVGYSLGGGLGWLARRYGLAADSIVSVEMVAGSGASVVASDDEHPDLFAALRGGGGGSLGIVTAIELRLFPVTDVYGGNLLWPSEDAAEVLDHYADFAGTAPEDFTSSVVLMNYPPLPQVPEPVRGRSFVILRGCHAGDLDEGRRLVDDWRAWKAPALDLFGPMPFSDVASISNDPVSPMPFHGSGMWLRTLDRRAADAMMRFTLPAGGPPPLVFSELRHVGGAVGRGGALSVYGNRDRELLLNMVGVVPGPEAAAAHHHHLAAYREALADLDAGAYLNFVEGDERRARLADALTTDGSEALRRAKATFDPENRFRFGAMAH